MLLLLLLYKWKNKQTVHVYIGVKCDLGPATRVPTTVPVCGTGLWVPRNCTRGIVHRHVVPGLHLTAGTTATTEKKSVSRG